jgi:hypothetical protein
MREKNMKTVYLAMGAHLITPAHQEATALGGSHRTADRP